MNIAIVGAGNVGSALATATARARHAVTITAAQAGEAERVAGVQLDGFLAGDDASAKQKVLELVESLGFRPIDAGPLAMARALEGMGTLNISLNMTNNWPWQTGWKLVGPTSGA